MDTFARWRIADPLRFFQRLRDERSAQSRLDDIIDGETRNAIASYNLIEAVRALEPAFEDDEYVARHAGSSEALEKVDSAATSSRGRSSSAPRRWCPSSASSWSTCRSGGSTTWTRSR